MVDVPIFTETQPNVIELNKIVESIDLIFIRPFYSDISYYGSQYKPMKIKKAGSLTSLLLIT